MKSLWSDRDTQSMSEFERLVYTSRLIGANPDLVLWGGGNSSVKVDGRDHAGRPVRILWMKGSGSDMRTMTAKHFTPLRLEDLIPLAKREGMTDEEMVAYQMKCILEPGSPKPSIETLLHAFLPPTHIYHTHADAICALTDTPDSAAVIEEVFGRKVALIPYYRPGFLLSKKTGAAFEKTPGLEAIILDKHGLITWGETAKEAYRETIRRVTQAERYIAKKMRQKKVLKGTRVRNLPAGERRALAAEAAPQLRGLVSRQRRMVLQYDDDPEVLEFANAQNAKELSQVGPFTPDHMLHTKPWPLFVDIDRTEDLGRAIAKALPKSMEQYRDRYTDYFNRYKTPGVTMLDPHPRVILIPGLGMFTTGKDRRAARIAHDLYRHTIRVIQHATAIGKYRVLLPQELCDFEYWPMENFKLTLLPPEKEFSRHVALVTGAARGIGKVVAERLAGAGASVILTDIEAAKVRKAAEAINEKAGEQVAVALEMDVTRERSVREGFAKAMLAFGGLDVLVSNAGIARTAPVAELSVDDWEASLSVNATGHFLVCREAMRVYRRQGIGGNIVVVATKNVLAPGKDFGAYSASKAAQTQLSRILAIEGGGEGIRVNMVNPDGVFEDSGLWSKQVRQERAKAHNVPIDSLEDFYAARNLLRAKISTNDVAEAVLFLASGRSAKTTGAIIPVDGGVREAFPR